MKLGVLVIFIFASIAILNCNEVRGCTHNEIYPYELTSIGQAKAYIPLDAGLSPEKTRIDSYSRPDRDEWELVDSLNLSAFMRPEKYLGVSFNNDRQSIEIISNYEMLVPAAIEAVDKAPAWMEADLVNIFSQLSEANQEIWAGIINVMIDPYLDEIAFAIANSSITYLSSPYSDPNLFIENAILIYSADLDLDYVEIIDYGNSFTDDNYYSTTLYWKINEDEELVQVEVPKEIYYMYIVHPKITDEIATYIDPDIIEDNGSHTTNIVDPPVGVFWRNFLYNSSDTGYPLLKDMLAECPCVWDASLTTDDDAILTLTDWINESMSFTSGYERPHQPVRIYRKHIGRCGEHADLTAAACRSALIPGSSILAISGDHTWNEFWDEGWHHWEPVNNSINNPLVYENGWGWQFASVFEIKSNGYLTPVTGTYSEGTSTITIYALDNLGEPIDGAKIMLAVQDGTSIYVDNFGYTDNEGKYDFIVGEGRTYYARMDSDIGNDPTTPNQVYLVVSNSIDGESYTSTLSAAGVMPETDFTEITPPEDDIDDYLLEFDFYIPNQIVYGEIVFNDLDNTYFYNSIEDEGVINYFTTDLNNFLLYDVFDPFEAFHTFWESSDGSVSFDIPVEEDWYAFFENGNNLNNPQSLTASVSFYQYIQSETEDSEIIPESYSLLQNYPNPFNPAVAGSGRSPATTISFNLTAEDIGLRSTSPGQAENAELIIYNIKGQKVKTFDVTLSGVEGSIIWDGKDDNNKPVSSGIYFYKLKAGKFEKTRKMILLR
jgi:transglutaminase-like putative cysteine protease